MLNSWLGRENKMQLETQRVGGWVTLCLWLSIVR